MANTFPAGLVAEFVAETGITSLGPVIGAVNAFSHGIGVDPVSPGSTINVGVTTAGSTTLTNPSNYEAGDSTKVLRAVTVSEYAQPFHVSQAELNKGHRLRHLVGKNMQALANACRDVVFAPLTVANFGSAVLDSTAANFDADDLKTIWAGASDYPTKNLLLDGAYYAKLLPSNAESFRPGETGAYGFDSIGVNNRWDGADTGVIGFIGGPDALCIASGEPVMDSGLVNLLDDYQEVEIAGGLSVFAASWVSLATRNRWMSLGLMLGAAEGDTTAGELITNGS